MDDMAQIPMMQKPVSMMEHGPNSQNLAAASAARHPVDQLQRAMAVQPFADLEHVRHVYGSGLAMRLATEHKIALQQEGGLPLGSSNIYRDVVTGNDLKMDFGDYLSLPEHQPEISRENLHLAAERKLGL
mmetsp:Transcript_15562/g.20265  ORF Transcript_15562/g.20265 Transcript_15562/m.20265 type:complete len:130 (+) Transcript_15562:139-528(+)|eukprot:CAMPEP_0198143162 /NCGR_PEP_ID=MMETSP1443-20131203/5912_1 /TAXON_ID=186043 /ORGANISM="Entomoneis sp., Strain CCMP2396" /LENGTH=129 /DNA_ID=CAMNT_0043806331 /DNA_START=107 /DNA_END=496 /DNA_ORIENTATION=+